MQDLFQPVLLSTAYLPPVQYFSKFLMNRKVQLESHENYQKQSYRNRCYIYGANGRQALVIPVLKFPENGCRILNIRIDHKTKWQSLHWKSIVSAYRQSPYFEYYSDDLAAFYHRRIDSLFEWNLALLRYILELLDIKTGIGYTGTWQEPDEGEGDFRNSIHPKERLNKPDPFFRMVPYHQVFISKFGFIPNLSIIDLIFNEGPHAGDVVRDSVYRI
ncbi:MAG: WbqC family protein [Bacteroidales bacterium]|nr:WbqC family protein [Bacteroidales bacterium]